MFTPMENPNTFAALAFLSGSSPDREGRYVTEYLTFTPERWEECHNHIQWAFPSSVPSMFNPNAPIIDFNEFLRHTYVDGFPVSGHTEDVYIAIGELMARYMDSIGIGLTNAGSVFIMKESHPERLAWIDNPRDHNHRRLTRLFMLWRHLQVPLEAFNHNLYVKHFESLYYYISTLMRTVWGDEMEETLQYWDRAFHQGTN